MGRLELAVAGLAATLLLSTVSSAAPSDPRAEGLRCLRACADARAVAPGGEIVITGRRLGGVTEVTYAGVPASVTVSPASAEPHAIRAPVPAGATSGPVTVSRSDGASDRTPRALRVVGPEEVLPPGSFRLRGSGVRLREAFFDAAREPRLRFRFAAPEPADVRIELIREGDVRRRWERSQLAPFKRHALRWDGLTEDGDAARRGRYRFRVGASGAGLDRAGRVRLRDHRFPVRGGHRYGDRFGAARSGGRTHEGQDVWAGCGTRLEAARGGHVQVRAFSGALYGHYVVIDGAKTDRDYMYAHLTGRVRVGDGDRVRTGQTLGFVGATGNARSEGCQLHFELWPDGFRRGQPANPRGELRRWDRYS